MKQQLLSFTFLLLCFQFLLAHPGIGIVADHQGNIYYTDLNQVWKVTPNGERSIYVPRVHTHELYLDGQENLTGEDAWYEGEATDKWGFAVWKRFSDGRIEFVIDSTEGFLFEHPYSIVHDGAGSTYWIEKDGKRSVFKKRSTEGVIQTLASGEFENIRWHYYLRDGLYFLDMDDLYRLRNGGFELVAENLRSEALPFSTFVRDMHSIMGVWDDEAGNIYAAVYSGKVVKKISPDGTVTDFFRTKGKWSPAGGLFDRDNNLWLLEYSSNNKARVRKFSPTDLNQPPVKIESQMDVTTWLLIALIVALAVGLLYLRQNNPRRRR